MTAKLGDLFIVSEVCNYIRGASVLNSIKALQSVAKQSSQIKEMKMFVEIDKMYKKQSSISSKSS